MTYPPQPPGPAHPGPGGSTGPDATLSFPAQGAPPPPVPPAAAPEPARRRSTGTIVGRAVLVLVVVAALAATTAWGFVNRRSAEEWKDRSQTAEEGLTRSLARVEATEADLEDATVRLRELANEKAGEVDQNRILSEIVAQAPEVTDALAECQAETATLANDIIDAIGVADADVADLEDRVDEVNEICDAALRQAEALEATIDGLG